ncbi:MAG: hypothetical protein ACK5P6_05475 [Pseudobdellovibrionaceae bacterium]|jgi:hypothetical protein
MKKELVSSLLLTVLISGCSSLNGFRGPQSANFKSVSVDRSTPTCEVMSVEMRGPNETTGTLKMLRSSSDKPCLPSSQDLFLAGTFELDPNSRQARHSYFTFNDKEHKFVGQALDLNVRRPVRQLTQTIFGDLYNEEGHLLIGNFYHNGNFYIANVPLDGVKNTYFNLKYFPPMIGGKYVAAHSFVRFEMQKPIKLVALMPSLEQWNLVLEKFSKGEEAVLNQSQIGLIEVDNIAASAEAQWTHTMQAEQGIIVENPQQSYDLIKGLQGYFKQIVRIVNFDSRLEESWINGLPDKQIMMNITSDEKQAILWHALLYSENDGIDHQYDTLAYNCTTAAVNWIENGLNRRYNKFGFIREFMDRRVPILSPHVIYQLGITKKANFVDTYTDSSLSVPYCRAFVSARDKVLDLYNVDMSKNVCANLDRLTSQARKKSETKELRSRCQTLLNMAQSARDCDAIRIIE